MPKLFILGKPTDQYRYRTFVDSVLRSNNKWGIKINYDPPSYFTSTSFLHRKLRRLHLLFKNLISIYKANVIYIPPMIVRLDLSSRIIMKWCTLMKKKVIYEFYLSEYDTCILDNKIEAPESRLASLAKKHDKWANSQEWVIYLNPCEAKRYKGLVDLDNYNNTYIIPLSIEARPFAKLNYYSNSSQNVFNIVWWGTYIPLHGLDKIVKCIHILSKRVQNVHLFILGNNEERSKRYLSLINSYDGLSNFITLSNDKSFNNGKLEPFLIEQCDLALGAFGDSEKSKNVILNKVIEAVAMKIPVITQYSRAFEEYFPKDKSIFYCEDEPEEMAAKIEKIIGLRNAELKNRLDTAYKIYEENFSIAATQLQMIKLLDLIAGNIGQNE